jgi:hypothetical protein
MIPPIVIAMVNIIAIVVAFSRTIYSANPQWSKFIGRGFFSLWVLAHLYPFAKGLMGRRGKTPTIVFVWSGLIANLHCILSMSHLIKHIYIYDILTFTKLCLTDFCPAE